MNQPKRNSLGIKFMESSNEEKCKKPEGINREKKKDEPATDGDLKKLKSKLKKISSYADGSEESFLSLRPNEFPVKPNSLNRKWGGSDRRRKKPVVEKTSDSAPEEKIGKEVEEVKGSESSFEKVLKLCRTKLLAMDERRNEVLDSVEMELMKQNVPDDVPVNMTDSNHEKDGNLSGHVLSRRASPKIDSYFKFKSSPWLKPQTTLDFQMKESESPKTNINLILKGHAQKVSGHSLKLGSIHDTTEFLRRVRMMRMEPSCKSSSIHSTKNYQKVINIQMREENKQEEGNNKTEVKEEECVEKKDEEAKVVEMEVEKKVIEVEDTGKKEKLGKDGEKKDVKKDGKKKDVEKKGAEKKDAQKKDVEVKNAHKKDTQKKEAEKNVTEKKDLELKDAEKKDQEKKDEDKKDEDRKDVKKEDEANTKKEDNPPVKKTSTEKVSEIVKRVTYTDRLLLHRFRRDSTEKLKTPGSIIASVIEKLNSPFKDELQKKLEVCLNGGDINKKSDETQDQKSAVKVPSDSALKSTVQKQRSAREATIDDQVNKSIDQLSKTKCARSSELRDLVAQAIKEHKIFCIFDNHWYIVRPVREELLNRGWLEVIPDRRLIPRRRPPPAGPSADRNPTPDYVMEAILTAREAFVDDYTDMMAKFPPAKIVAEKPKMQRKLSEESLKETYSEFRIVPPSPEKKKNNQDIRDFVGKCHYMVLRKQTLRQGNYKKGKIQPVKSIRNGKAAADRNPDEDSSIPTCPSSATNIEDIIHSVQQNRKLLSQLSGVETKEEPRQPDDVSKESRISLSENDAKIASKIIQSSNARIHFMWLSIKPAIHLKCFNYSPEIVNKFQKTTFCTKIGLWSHLNNIQWYAHEVTFPAKSPRMYNTGEADDLQAFFHDFHMTACIGILKWLSETFFDKGMKGVQKKKGKVPIKAFEFAIRQCERYIRFRENDDLNILEDSKVMQDEWNTFLQWFYIITNDHGKLQETSNAQLMVVYTKAVEVLRAMKRHWPEIDIDGRLNIWIMKPYCASCGRGIFMTNNVYYIGQHSKYIVQKYIERPLLIYNTKFDIRQWFMITKLVPLEIWMYKECYLRFCTQPFVLRNLHESVHLSNNSVQRKYVNQKDSGLPDQNMWDSNTFQQYLKTIGQPNAWNEVIYPGMRDAIISLMLAAQDTFDSQRKSWFEVYGADFMISANLKDGPWLIEINESPAMDPSTKVTSRLCPQMLRDVIKVVVDKRANKNAPTGQWELVYRQNYSPSYGTISIDVKGKRIARAPQNKTGYTNNWAPPPFFFTGTVKETSPEKDDPKKKYEIIKSYKTGRDAVEVNLDSTKSSNWANLAKPRLIKETSTPSVNRSKQ